MGHPRRLQGRRIPAPRVADRSAHRHRGRAEAARSRARAGRQGRRGAEPANARRQHGGARGRDRVISRTVGGCRGEPALRAAPEGHGDVLRERHRRLDLPWATSCRWGRSYFELGHSKLGLLLQVFPMRFGLPQLAVKRTMDLTLTLLGLAVIWPLLVLVAIAVKLDSTRPGALSPNARRGRRSLVPHPEVPDDGGRRGSAEGASSRT